MPVAIKYTLYRPIDVLAEMTDIKTAENIL